MTSLWFKNELEVCGFNPSIPSNEAQAGFTPHHFTTTNIHTHGLHVAPNAPSDDVLVTVRSRMEDGNPHGTHHDNHDAHAEQGSQMDHGRQGRWPIPSEATAYLMPIWRDTVYFDTAGIDRDRANPDLSALAGRRVLATSYQVDYTGEFVLHCHSLFHEDNGMMLSVQIND